MAISVYGFNSECMPGCTRLKVPRLWRALAHKILRRTRFPWIHLWLKYLNKLDNCPLLILRHTRHAIFSPQRTRRAEIMSWYCKRMSTWAGYKIHFRIIFRSRKQGRYNCEKAAIFHTTFQYVNHYGQDSVWSSLLTAFKDHCCHRGLDNLFPYLPLVS